VKPRLIRSISAAQDIPIWPSDPKESDEPVLSDLPLVMDPRDAYQVTSMLQSVVDYGTGRTIRDYGVKGLVAGKTGTTNSGTDVWFVGYTPTVIAAFWFGFDQPAPISGDASGGRLAAPAWAEFYLQGWRETASPNAWNPPAGMVERVIDPTNGYLATEWCPVTRNEYYKPELPLPTIPCPEHGPDMNNDQNGQPAQPDTIDDFGRRIGRALGKIFHF
jgi:membrane carboxypeptidase/penicillin-binding protein